MSARHVLLFFLDGIGLGQADPAINAFASAAMPNLASLLGGQRLLASTPGGDYGRATFVPTDAEMGLPGPPQSASGQAAIVTGRNVPREIGGHWGPKPNEAIAAILRQGSVFSQLSARGLRAGLLNAYPNRYFESIDSGRRSYSAIPLAVTLAGLPLLNLEDLNAGRALSADFTGAGWPEPGAPVLTAHEAGGRLAELAAGYSFSFFEYWISDYIGHRGDLGEARRMLEQFDQVLGGLLEAWDDQTGLIVITSDHGNMEDLSHRHHTLNRVPTIAIGAARDSFAAGLDDLTHIAPGVMRVLGLA